MNLLLVRSPIHITYFSSRIKMRIPKHNHNSKLIENKLDSKLLRDNIILAKF